MGTAITSFSKDSNSEAITVSEDIVITPEAALAINFDDKLAAFLSLINEVKTINEKVALLAQKSYEEREAIRTRVTSPATLEQKNCGSGHGHNLIF